MKILMVCLGNICRSPLAEGIMRQKISDHNLDWEVASCGTGGWHVGEGPDRRSVRAAALKGYDISNQRAQQFNESFLDIYDHIFVMDQQNYKDVERVVNNKDLLHKVQLFIPNGKVIDPYYDDTLFSDVCDQIETRCELLIKELKASV